MRQVSKSAIAISVFACATIFSMDWSEQAGVSLSVQSAQARVGRPLTPVSVAGVARRQTRRAVYGYGLAGAAAVGAAATVAAGSYYGSPGYYGGPYQTGYYGRPYQTGYYGGSYQTGYYGGGPYASYGYPVQDYATRNGFKCQPGTMTKLDDGRMYPCQ
jgi:hypothetical protein